MDVKHIAVSGNIGAGKTTLVQNLSHHFDWTAQYEEVESNPYLDDFYSDMHRWAFNLQIFGFLHQRYSQILEIREEIKPSYKTASMKMLPFLLQTFIKWALCQQEIMITIRHSIRRWKHKFSHQIF